MDEDLAPGWGLPGNPLDRILDRIGNIRSLPLPGLEDPPRALGPPSPVLDLSESVREAPADILVTVTRVHITLEILGASRDEIHLEATDRSLTVRARGYEGRVYHRRIELPDTVDPESLEATCRNGVLDITIPRSPSRRVRNQGGDTDGR